MTTSTRVCWSMISLTQILYGSRVARHGSLRRCRPYQRTTLRRKALTVARGRVNRVGMAERSSYTVRLPADKISQLKADLEARGYVFRDLEYAHFAAEHRGEKVNVAMYKSGKFVIQGKGTTDFIQFYLEPCLLGEARLGYEHIHNPSMLEARIGVDESGKGDLFGPLVVAGVYLDGTTAMQ